MGTKGNVTERLTAYLRELHLPTLRECFEELAQRALKESSSYQQYLLELIAYQTKRRLHAIWVVYLLQGEGVEWFRGFLGDDPDRPILS